jgi:hypothetical protein
MKTGPDNHLGPLITLTHSSRRLTRPPGVTSRASTRQLSSKNFVAKYHQGEMYVQPEISYTLFTVGMIIKLGYDLLQIIEKSLHKAHNVRKTTRLNM